MSLHRRIRLKIPFRILRVDELHRQGFRTPDTAFAPVDPACLLIQMVTTQR